MTFTRLLGVLAAGGLVFVGTLFFFDSQTRSLERHSEAIDELQLLKEADAGLTRDVLRARFGMLPSYDPLTSSLTVIRDRRQAFWEAAGSAYGSSRQRLKPEWDNLTATMQAKAGLIEQFKSHNAVLKNSRSYIPVADERLMRLARENPGLDEELQHGGPIRKILLFYVTGDMQYVPRIREALEGLRTGGHVPAAASVVSLLTAHTETIIRERQTVRSLLAQILSYPSGQRIDELQQACQVQYQQSTEWSDKLQAALFVVSVAMLVSIAWVVLRLRGTTFALNRANETLEQRVMERTCELSRANNDLAREVETRRRTEVELLSAKVAAESANRAKSEFLANMSHEIRTPINGILGMTDLVLDSELTGEQRESLELVQMSTESLMTVINDILDFSKIEAGKLDFDPIEFRLRDLLGDMLKTLALRAHRKGLELTCDIGENVPDRIIGDSGRLRQILVNLAGNAIKFTERGEVCVRVRFEGEVEGQYRLAFAVIDTGIGIPADKHAVIFDAFSQADGSTTRRFGGTGLGLTISCRLVAMMGGQITVESEVGRGSKFRFNVPFSKPTTAAAEPSTISPAALSDLAVLVIDDNSTNRRVLSGFLRLWNMHPTAVDSGPAAIDELRSARAAGKPYPLMLVDQMMPEMDGFQLVEQLQAEPGLAPATIMMLTSADRRADASRCKELQIASYLVKPLKADELQLAILATLQGGPVADCLTSKPLEKAAATAASVERPLRILLAEDNAVNQKVAIYNLRKAGHSIVVVANGKLAVETVEREPFDLVLMDVQMPEMDGFEATAVIRARETETGGRHLPIIAMTAHAMKGDRERCLAAGMDDYVSKPVQPAELLRVVRSVRSGTEALDLTSLANSASDSTPAPERVVFDRASALDRVAGDEAILSEVIEIFLAEVPGQIDKVRQAVAAGDCKALGDVAHTLKGSAGCLGGLAAATAARELEESAKRGDLSRAATALREFEGEIESLSKAMSPFVLQAHV
jgi:signal transduction histidine kinase/CheY-like chemotaxis protein